MNVKKQGWINLFKTHDKACVQSLVIHQTEDDAIRNTFSTSGYRFPDYITTIEKDGMRTITIDD